MYRRLLGYLRPHGWRMVGTIACNVIAAALDVFSFTLLVPFLNALFGAPSFIPKTSSWISGCSVGESRAAARMPEGNATAMPRRLRRE